MRCVSVLTGIRQGTARQGKARQGKARQRKARQGKQGKARQARQGKARQHNRFWLRNSQDNAMLRRGRHGKVFQQQNTERQRKACRNKVRQGTTRGEMPSNDQHRRGEGIARTNMIKEINFKKTPKIPNQNHFGIMAISTL